MRQFQESLLKAHAHWDCDLIRLDFIFSGNGYNGNGPGPYNSNGFGPFGPQGLGAPNNFNYPQQFGNNGFNGPAFNPGLGMRWILFVVKYF